LDLTPVDQELDLGANQKARSLVAPIEAIYMPSPKTPTNVTSHSSIYGMGHSDVVNGHASHLALFLLASFVEPYFCKGI